MPTLPTRLPPLLQAGLLILLLGTHAWMALTASREKSATADEMAHLTAGLAYWQFNDYRLQPENGNLPQRWEALPAWLGGHRLPADHPDWPVANVWGVGRAYFAAHSADLADLLFAARAMNVVWSLGTGLLVWWWARRLFGATGALLALTLFAFCPTFLAHGALATSDMCMAFFMLASVTACWRHLEELHPGKGLVSAVVFGLACVAKFSCVLLPLIFAPMWLARLLSARPLPWRGREVRSLAAKAALLAVSAVAHILAAFTIIWLFFGFRHGAAGPGLPALVTYHMSWETALNGLGLKGTLIGMMRPLAILPDAYLYGFTFVLNMSQQRAAYLNGDYSLTGWVQFFPYAFLVKTPLPLLIAIGASGVISLRRWWRQPGSWRTDLFATLPLASSFIIYWLFSLGSHLNIGHRHLLPTYPALFILCGAIGWASRREMRSPTATLLICLLLGTQAAASLRVRPHYLAFFNHLAGGPEEGWRHLVDSSLDWGQDLPGLARRLRAEETRPGQPRVYVSYFGTDDPARYGINAVELPTLPFLSKTRPWHTLQPGLYALSATMLSHVYSRYRGEWTQEREESYQKLRALEPLLLRYAAEPDNREALMPGLSPDRVTGMWDTYEQLRFARLCHYLRARGADEQIGYSILIFRLSAVELTAALHRPYSVWLRAMEHAATRGESAKPTPP
ncbi:MAG: ArnT family glycosyltransferase [Verrucomicrobiota bacterium]